MSHLVFVLLASMLCGDVRYKGTVQSVTSTSVNLIVGVGESLRIVKVILTEDTTRQGALQPGDVALVVGEVVAPSKVQGTPTFVVANRVRKCEVNEFGLVEECN